MSATVANELLATTPMCWVEWEKVLARAKLGKGSTTAVGFALGTYTDGDGSNGYPGYQRLADGLGLSVSTIDRAMTRLEKLGYITRETGSVGRPGHAVHWQLSVPSALDGEKPSSGTSDVQPDHSLITSKGLTSKEKGGSVVRVPQLGSQVPADRWRSSRRDRTEFDEGGNPIRSGSRSRDRSAYGVER